MPFQSDAQRRFMYAQHPGIAKRWAKHTPKGKDLPEKKTDSDPEETKANAEQEKKAFVRTVGLQLGLVKNANLKSKILKNLVSGLENYAKYTIDKPNETVAKATNTIIDKFYKILGKTRPKDYTSFIPPGGGPIFRFPSLTRVLQTAAQGAGVGGTQGLIGGTLAGLPDLINSDEPVSDKIKNLLASQAKGGLIGAGVGGAMGGLAEKGLSYLLPST